MFFEFYTYSNLLLIFYFSDFRYLFFKMLSKKNRLSRGASSRTKRPTPFLRALRLYMFVPYSSVGRILGQASLFVNRPTHHENHTEAWEKRRNTALKCPSSCAAPRSIHNPCHHKIYPKKRGYEFHLQHGKFLLQGLRPLFDQDQKIRVCNFHFQ